MAKRVVMVKGRSFEIEVVPKNTPECVELMYDEHFHEGDEYGFTFFYEGAIEDLETEVTTAQHDVDHFSTEDVSFNVLIDVDDTVVVKEEDLLALVEGEVVRDIQVYTQQNSVGNVEMHDDDAFVPSIVQELADKYLSEQLKGMEDDYDVTVTALEGN